MPLVSDLAQIKPIWRHLDLPVSAVGTADQADHACIELGMVISWTHDIRDLEAAH